MKTMLLLSAVSIAVIVGGCSAYKARDEGFGKMGYVEKKLEDGSFMLSYYGSSLDNEDDAKEKWNRRASELCGKRVYEAEIEAKEWAYDNYAIIPPIFVKSKGASPLIEGKLKCKT
jgi:hypothetical protein